MISPAVYDGLKKLATISDPDILYQLGKIKIGSHDAKAIVEALDMVAVLKGLLAGGELTATMVRVLLADTTTETVDVAGKAPELTPMSINQGDSA